MTERKTIFLGNTFKYKGLIDVKGIYQVIFKYLSERGYQPFDAEHAEEIYEDGKQITIKIKGERDVSTQSLVKWETKLVFTKLEHITIEESIPKKLFKGNFTMVSEAFLETTYDGSFKQHAIWYFIRVLLDKYAFFSYNNRAMGKASHDYKLLEAEVKNYLNMERYD